MDLKIKKMYPRGHGKWKPLERLWEKEQCGSAEGWSKGRNIEEFS